MATPAVIWSTPATPFWMSAEPTATAPPVAGGGPVPTAKVLQGGIVGAAYSQTISVQGGTAPYTFAVTVGSLPPGLSLDGVTGIISGTPTTVQTADFTVQATDANGTTGSTDFEIGVMAATSGGATNYCIID